MSDGTRPQPCVGRILADPEHHGDETAAGERLRTAFVVSGPCVVTAAHCVRDANRVGGPLWFRVANSSNSGYADVPVQVATVDETLDVAVLTVDLARLDPDDGGAAPAVDLLSEMAIPLATSVGIGEQVRVMGFPASKLSQDSDTFLATVVDTALPAGDVKCLKLQGPEFAAVDPVDPHGLSGGPVLKALDMEKGPSAGEVVIGVVRAAPTGRRGDTSAGGGLWATRLQDALRLVEIAAAVRADADAGRSRRKCRYAAEIARLRPEGGLLDRDLDLAELASFARPGQVADAGPAYADWVAAAFAGKTALAAEFVSAPPPGVDIVAFFVSRRLGQQTSQFWEHTCDQLSALLGRPKPAASDNAAFSSLWSEAGQAAEGAKRTLLLLIDGLDENDTRPLIASFIPVDGDRTRRIVVFRRELPELSLNSDHPLLDERMRIRRKLLPDEHAQILRAKGEEALRVLLDVPDALDVLGALATAGPLTVPEIGELLKIEPMRREGKIRPVLRHGLEEGLLMPTFDPQTRYAFQHETLLELTLRSRDDGGAAFRDAINDWADDYAARGWPEETPEYLLLGYPAMLARTKDSARLAALSGPARLSRIRLVTGDDGAAIDEITLALGQLGASPTPDVPTACRLALRREEILIALAWYPMVLIRTHAALGHWAHAHRLASHLERPIMRVEALVWVAQSAVAAGEEQLADRLYVEALLSAKDIAESVNSFDAFNAVMAIAHSSAATGRLLDPRVVATTFKDPSRAVTAVASFAQSAATSGHFPEAGRFIAQGYASAAKLDTRDGEPPKVVPSEAGMSFTSVAERQAAIQKHLNALQLIGQAAAAVAHSAAVAGRVDLAAQVLKAIPLPDARISAINDVCRQVTAATGATELGPLLADARREALKMDDPGARVFALASLAQASAALGLPADDLVADARHAVTGIAHPSYRARALAVAAQGAAAGGLSAADLISEARAIAAAEPDPAEEAAVLALIGQATRNAQDFAGALERARSADEFRRPGVLETIAQAALSVGDFAAARAAVCEMPDPDRRARDLATIGQAALTAGDLAAARAVVGEMTDPQQCADALIAIARVGVTAGQPVGDLIADAVKAAGAIGDTAQRAWIMANVVEAAAQLGQPIAGEMLAARRAAAEVTDPYRRAGILTTVAAAARTAGQGIEDLVVEIRSLVPEMKFPAQRAWILGGLALVAAATGKPELAQDLVSAAEDDATARNPILRASALGAMASALDLQPGHGSSLFAEARRVTDLSGAGQRIQALVELARFARGRPEWAAMLKAEAHLAAGLPDPGERAQALAALAQAAGDSMDLVTAATIVGTIPDPWPRAVVSLSLARAAATQGNPALADQFFAQAAQDAARADVVVAQSAPRAILEAALACRRVAVARATGARLGAGERESAMSAIDIVSQIDGTEDESFMPLPDGNWASAIAQAAAAAGWFSTAEMVAGWIFDLNIRAFVHVVIAEAELAAGLSDRASTLATSVRSLAGQIERPLRTRALAVAVRAIAGRDREAACRELVRGLPDSFSTDLFVVAQELDAATVDALVAELGVRC